MKICNIIKEHSVQNFFFFLQQKHYLATNVISSFPLNQLCLLTKILNNQLRSKVIFTSLLISHLE